MLVYVTDIKDEFKVYNWKNFVRLNKI